MKTMTFDVRSLKGGLDEVASTVSALKAMNTARNSFASRVLLWQVLSAKRWEILKAMAGAIRFSLARSLAGSGAT